MSLRERTPESLRLRPGNAWARLRVYLRPSPPPPASQPGEQALYGFAQPLLGLRLLVQDSRLLAEAVTPAALLAAFCAMVAGFQMEGHGFRSWLGAFYKTFAVLAPLPSVLFAKHYARLAAVVRWRLGFGACGPREMPLGMSLRRAIQQAILIAVGVVPFAFVWRVLPGVGTALSQAVVALWGVHWVVVDALDDARVLAPGESLAEAEENDQRAPPPWFIRVLHGAADRAPLRPLAGALRRFARLCDRLSLPWRGEIALMEGHPAIAFGFAISTAALLATPVLNLLFRPIILIGSAHLLGHLEKVEQPHALNAAGTPTSALAK